MLCMKNIFPASPTKKHPSVVQGVENLNIQGFRPVMMRLGCGDVVPILGGNMSGKTGCKITLANIWIQVDMVIRFFVAFGTPSQKKIESFLRLCFWVIFLGV